jgi:hypothetical protein
MNSPTALPFSFRIESEREETGALLFGLHVVRFGIINLTSFIEKYFSILIFTASLLEEV